jgi:hypothetical protein
MTRALASLVVFVTTAVPVSVLDSEPDTWDGEEVIVAGEVVGDFSVRGDVVWFQLNDDAYATTPLPEGSELQGTNTGIGVRIPRTEWSEAWGGPGRYGRRGPIVEITGTFLHNSPADQGETFIDGSSARLVEVARPIANPPASTFRAITGILLAVIGLGLYQYGRRPRYRRRA